MSRSPRLLERYGGWALVAGAAQGIGRAFALRLAREGFPLLLLDRDELGLEQLADEIAAQGGGPVRWSPMDLGDGGVLARLDELLREVPDPEVGLLVYNAAHSHVGSFVSQTLASKLGTLEVNCRGPLLLSHRFAEEMVQRGRGGIILLSSLAGLNGHRLTAAYAASKAYNLVLAEALWDELGSCGVDVLAVCAGMTSTPGFRQSGPELDLFKARLVMEPEQVVEQALTALGHRPSVITGWPNRLTALLTQRILPRKAASAFMGRMVGQVYPGRQKN